LDLYYNVENKKGGCNMTQVNWSKTLDDALKVAGQTGKPVFVDFYNPA
jgi:hypothetical protein